MITQFLLYFGACAFLFFLVSLLTKPKFLIITIPLNVAFLGLLLFSYVQFLGTSLPFQYDIPFWKFQQFTAQSVVHVKGGVIDEELIHLLVKEGAKPTKYITLKNDPETVAKLMKAIKERGGWDFDMTLDSKYGSGSGSNFLLLEPMQDNHSHANEKLKLDGGIESHDHDSKDEGGNAS